jgi:hypothetical protein
MVEKEIMQDFSLFGILGDQFVVSDQSKIFYQNYLVYIEFFNS